MRQYAISCKVPADGICCHVFSLFRSGFVVSEVHQGWKTVYRNQLTQSYSRKAICFQEELNLLAVLVLQMSKDEAAALPRAV